MSTFGKKALENWDYNASERIRFVKSDTDLQLQILEKWYPIGEVGYIKSSQSIKEGSKIIIDSYILHVGGFYSIKANLLNGTYTAMNPLSIRIPKFERDIKIEKLLK